MASSRTLVAIWQRLRIVGDVTSREWGSWAQESGRQRPGMHSTTHTSQCSPRNKELLTPVSAEMRLKIRSASSGDIRSQVAQPSFRMRDVPLGR